MSVIPRPYASWAKQCTECGRIFEPSSRHLRCPACRAKTMCACGRTMQAKSVQCGSCRTTSNEANGNWKGGRTLHKAGYVMVRVPEHPRAKKSPYVFEHILVAEQLLGRYLEPGESVHHRNGIRDDNRPENLELWTKPQPAGIRVSDAIAWALEILDRYVGEGRGTPPTMLTAAVSTLGGGGSRTRVFRVVGGASPSAAGDEISGHRRSPAACGDPSLSEVSRRALRPCPGGEPLLMAPRFRPSGWAGRDALLVGTRQRG